MRNLAYEIRELTGIIRELQKNFKRAYSSEKCQKASYSPRKKPTNHGTIEDNETAEKTDIAVKNSPAATLENAVAEESLMPDGPDEETDAMKKERRIRRILTAPPKKRTLKPAINDSENIYTSRELVTKRKVNGLLLMRLVDSGILPEYSKDRFRESDILRCIKSLEGLTPLRTLINEVFRRNISGDENPLIKISDFEHELYIEMEKAKKLPGFIKNIGIKSPFYAAEKGCEYKVYELFKFYGIEKYFKVQESSVANSIRNKKNMDAGNGKSKHF